MAMSNVEMPPASEPRKRSSEERMAVPSADLDRVRDALLEYPSEAEVIANARKLGMKKAAVKEALALLEATEQESPDEVPESGPRESQRGRVLHRQQEGSVFITQPEFAKIAEALMGGVVSEKELLAQPGKFKMSRAKMEAALDWVHAQRKYDDTRARADASLVFSPEQIAHAQEALKEHGGSKVAFVQAHEKHGLTKAQARRLLRVLDNPVLNRPPSLDAPMLQRYDLELEEEVQEIPITKEDVLKRAPSPEAPPLKKREVLLDKQKVFSVEERDPVYEEARSFIEQRRKPSIKTSTLADRFKLSWTRAAALMDQLVYSGFLEPHGDGEYTIREKQAFVAPEPALPREGEEGLIDIPDTRAAAEEAALFKADDFVVEQRAPYALVKTRRARHVPLVDPLRPQEDERLGRPVPTPRARKEGQGVGAVKPPRPWEALPEEDVQSLPDIPDSPPPRVPDEKKRHEKPSVKKLPIPRKKIEEAEKARRAQEIAALEEIPSEWLEGEEGAPDASSPEAKAAAAAEVAAAGAGATPDVRERIRWDLDAEAEEGGIGRTDVAAMYARIAELQRQLEATPKDPAYAAERQRLEDQVHKAWAVLEREELRQLLPDVQREADDAEEERDRAMQAAVEKEKEVLRAREIRDMREKQLRDAEAQLQVLDDAANVDPMKVTPVQAAEIASLRRQIPEMTAQLAAQNNTVRQLEGEWRPLGDALDAAQGAYARAVEAERKVGENLNGIDVYLAGAAIAALTFERAEDSPEVVEAMAKDAERVRTQEADRKAKEQAIIDDEEAYKKSWPGEIEHGLKQWGKGIGGTTFFALSGAAFVLGSVLKFTMQFLLHPLETTKMIFSKIKKFLAKASGHSDGSGGGGRPQPQGG